MFSNSKGQWLQLIFIIVFLLVLGILFLFLSNFTDEINQAIQSEPEFSEEAKAQAASHDASVPGFFQGFMLLVIGGGWLLSLGLAYNSGGSPLLLVVALLVIVALGFSGMIMSNVWEEIGDDENVSDDRDSMPVVSFFLDNYLTLVLVMGFTVLIVGLSRGGMF